MTTPDTTQAPPAPVRPNALRRFLGPGIVFGLLAIQFAMCGVTLMVALANPVQLVEDDYYAAAVRWDERLAAERLGWSAELELTRYETRPSERAMTIRLLDENGEPVRGAHGTVTAYPHAGPSRRREYAATFDEEGVARLGVSIARIGWWELIVEAEREGESFRWSDTRFIYPAADPPAPAGGGSVEGESDG